MASVPLLDGVVDGPREKRRWVENKVYTRKAHNKALKPNLNQTHQPLTQIQPPSSQQTLATVTDVINSSLEQRLPWLPLEHFPPVVLHRSSAATDDEATSHRPNLVNNHHLSNGHNKVITIDLASKAKHEVRDLRRKLTCELDLVRSLERKLQAWQRQLSMNDNGKINSPPGHNISQLSAIDTVSYFSIRRAPAISETASAADPTPVCHQLTVFSIPTAACGDSGIVNAMEKEKQTPKSNQYYKNTDFLLGKEKFPPPESNKKSKVNEINNGMQSFESKINDQTFKKCSFLLSKLMKHNYSWVFNTPIDARALNLPDYNKIITHPMDLGTVKSRLSANWYKTPKEFANDVRLTFHNAMTYNPKGQDAHILAHQLLQIFEEQWPLIEADLAYSHSPLSMKRSSPFDMRNLERPDSIIKPLVVDLKTKSLNQLTNIGQSLASKKPKAKDSSKREMTFEEKQRLSNNLENLPPEKLDMVVQLIKKKNLSLSQNDDEIEVDIDIMDTETLWELDRFVTNYKKNLSKHKRKAELAIHSKVLGQHTKNWEQKMVTNSAPPELLKENKRVEKIDASSSLIGGTKVGENKGRSSNSSSSNSGSSSPSSGSDSESSSGYGSDGAQSPRT